MRTNCAPDSTASEKQSLVERALRVAPFLKGTVLSVTGLQLPEQITLEQWESIGRELGRLQSASSWQIGDWWVYGQQEYGDRKALVESEEWTGPVYGTCKNTAVVCRSFERSRRRDLLTFTHHVVVAALPAEQADSLLDWCEGPLKTGTGKPKPLRALREEIAQRGLRPTKSAALEEDLGEDDKRRIEASTEVMQPQSCDQERRSITVGRVDEVRVAHPVTVERFDEVREISTVVYVRGPSLPAGVSGYVPVTVLGQKKTDATVTLGAEMSLLEKTL